MPLLKHFAQPPGLDDLFVRRYDELVSWARQLVGRDRAAAADLVHDAFLRLSLRGVDLRTIENVDGYLFVTLRNVHLSQIRRREPSTLISDSLLAHESIQASLNAVAASERREAARQELVLIARYASLRKGTSRGASALLLRFFHGYYPGEIAGILQTTPAAVDVRLRMARLEAQTFVADPDRLRTIDRTRVWTLPDADEDSDFISALRASLFDADPEACVPQDALDRLYTLRQDADVGAPTLAHLVSCQRCLDAVNRRLGLPTLAERDPSERLGRGGRNGPGGRSSGGAGGGQSSPRTELRTRLRDALDDRPKELRVVVNGVFVGSQAVQHGVSEQCVKVLIGERIGFIEIFSEHSTCLLYLDVIPPPDGPAEQTVSVKLTGERDLSATVTFHEAAPEVHVEYRDPAPMEVDASDGVTARRNMRAPLSHPVEDLRPVFGWLAPFLTLRPVLSVTVICVLGAIAWAVWSGRSVSASELLHTASLAESHPLPPGVATQQLLTMEHRVLPSAQVVSRQRIEVWRDDARGMTVERLFDERNRIVAGVWTYQGGARTVYRAGEPPSAETSATAIGRASLRDAWQHLPSATGFRAFVGLVEDAALEIRASEYVLSYRPLPLPENGLLEVTLTLNRADRRATAATMVLREAGQIHQLTFSETTLRRVRTESVQPEIFTPDLPLTATSNRSGEVVAPPRRSIADAPVVPALTPQYLDQLELQSMNRLHRARLWVGHGATITRSTAGLVVSAMAASDERRAVLLREFDTLKNRREIVLEVHVAPDDSAVSGTSTLEMVRQRRLRLNVLRSLIDDWPESRLRQLPLELVVTWQVMVQEHAEAIGAMTQQIWRELAPSLSVSPREAMPPRETEAFLSTLAEAQEAVGQLSAFIEDQDGVLVTAFDACRTTPCASADLTRIGPSFPALDALASRFARFYLKVNRPPNPPER